MRCVPHVSNAAYPLQQPQPLLLVTGDDLQPFKPRNLEIPIVRVIFPRQVVQNITFLENPAIYESVSMISLIDVPRGSVLISPPTHDP